MMKFMTRYTEQSYAILRMVSGFLFIWHGSQKLFGFPGGFMEGVPPFITYIAGPIELIGGVLICIGLLTRVSAFLSSGLMAVAYWMAHSSMESPWPSVNHGDAAILYCFVFLYIAAQGAGIWSLDSRKSD